ncbi:MAG: matrixin family metalloprotease [Deltaproteobacteria bacterium]|nr:MAG: matrixin family metalloprotease [Deltaproteobacteria bacterium]
MRKPLWLGSVLLLLCCGVVQPVDAFERIKNQAGKEVFWPRTTGKAVVKYYIQQEGLGDYFKANPTLGVAGSEMNAVKGAFLLWSTLTCSDGRPVGLSAQFQGLLPPAQAKVGYDPNCASCNTNLVVFIRDRNLWRHNDLVLSKTTLNFNETTGEIVDADIEINATGKFILTTQTQQPENIKWDILNIMAHEAGRFLGLDTSTDPKATMAAKSSEGDLSLRSLEKDDVDGICTIYPPSDNAQQVPLYQEVEAQRDLGCSSVPGSAPSLGSLVLLLFGLLLLVRRSRA